MKRILTMAFVGVIMFAVVLPSTGCAQMEMLEKENKSLKGENARLGRLNRDLQQQVYSLQDQLGQVRQSREKDQELIDRLKQQIGKTPGLDILRTPEGIVIRLSNKILFALGQFQLDAGARASLQKIGQILSSDFAGHHFRVVGHSDRVPIKAGRRKEIPTNWEMSCLRACSVVRFLIDNKYVTPEQIVAAGQSYFNPAVPWGGRKNVAQNRRVEILVLPRMKKKGSSSPGAPVPPPVTPK